MLVETRPVCQLPVAVLPDTTHLGGMQRAGPGGRG